MLIYETFLIDDYLSSCAAGETRNDRIEYQCVWCGKGMVARNFPHSPTILFWRSAGSVMLVDGISVRRQTQSVSGFVSLSCL